MDRKDVLGEPIITVSPSFEGAPDDWISRFDRVNSVLKHYDFSSVGEEQYRVRVVLSEPVRRVLDVIKRDMPNRRVVGRKAEAFLRNPYALLGESSHNVIDEAIFTGERDKLGDLQHSWSLEPKLEQGWIIHVDVRIEAEEHVNNEAIASSLLLHNFLMAIEDGLSQQQLSYKWKGYRLLLDHQAQQHLVQGERILAMWAQQEKSGIHRINYEDIYDLRQYGERVIGIAESKPIAIPVLLKPESDEQGWSPEFEPALLVQLPHAEEPVLLPATQNFCTTLNAHIQAAEESHAATVELPYLHLSVPLEQAQYAARVIGDHLQTKLGFIER